jgi:hypothetical protein
MRPLLLALLLTASLNSQAGPGGPGPTAYTPPPRARVNELYAETGLLTGGYSFEGGGWNDVYLTSGGGALYLFGGLTVEGSLLSLLPLERNGPGASLSLAVRVGYTGQRWSVVAGPVLQGAHRAEPLFQLLPSVHGLYDVGPVRLDAGLLDGNGMVPAHVGVSYGPVGLGYVLPLGVRAQARIPLTARAALQVSGFAFRLFGAHSALLTVGLVGQPPSSRPGASP